MTLLIWTDTSSTPRRVTSALRTMFLRKNLLKIAFFMSPQPADWQQKTTPMSTRSQRLEFQLSLPPLTLKTWSSSKWVHTKVSSLPTSKLKARLLKEHSKEPRKKRETRTKRRTKLVFLKMISPHFRFGSRMNCNLMS